MQEYKFYLIRKDGHINAPATEHELPDDQAAVKTANALAKDLDIEIWQGTRLVAYVVADEERQTPPGPKPDNDQHK